MDRTIDELTTEVNQLKEVVTNQTALINKIIVMMHIADTDLKNHLDMLD